jgi:hypothetical protein
VVILIDEVRDALKDENNLRKQINGKFNNIGIADEN